MMIKRILLLMLSLLILCSLAAAQPLPVTDAQTVRDRFAADGTLVYDDAGTPYMIYSRDCSENVVGSFHESHLYGVQLADDLLSVVGKGVLLTQPDTQWELASGDYRWNEGPAVLKHEGKYYLFYSANFYGSKEYAPGIAAADHPMGPYTKQSNNPVLNYVENSEGVIVSGPGHNSFFTVGDEIFTSYHTHPHPKAPSGNRQLNIGHVGKADAKTDASRKKQNAPGIKPPCVLLTESVSCDSRDERRIRRAHAPCPHPETVHTLPSYSDS